MQGRTPSAQGTALHSTCRHPRLVCFTKRLGPASAGKPFPPPIVICCGTAIVRVWSELRLSGPVARCSKKCPFPIGAG